MGANVCQHVALRVGDLDRAARFYIDAFGGRYLAMPFVIEDPEMEGLFGGHAGLKVKVCILGFDEGVIELFQFLEPSRPTAPEGPDPKHADALVRAGGGRGDCPGPGRGARGEAGAADGGLERVQVLYCYDLDGNVFEMLDSSMEDTAERTFESVPRGEAAGGVASTSPWRSARLVRRLTTFHRKQHRCETPHY